MGPSSPDAGAQWSRQSQAGRLGLLQWAQKKGMEHAIGRSLVSHSEPVGSDKPHPHYASRHVQRDAVKSRKGSSVNGLSLG